MSTKITYQILQSASNVQDGFDATADDSYRSAAKFCQVSTDIHGQFSSSVDPTHTSCTITHRQ